MALVWLQWAARDPAKEDLMTHIRMLSALLVLAGCSGSSTTGGVAPDAAQDAPGGAGGTSGTDAGGAAGSALGGTAGVLASGGSAGAESDSGSFFSPCAPEAFACYYPLDKGCTNHQCDVANHCCVWPCLKDSDCNFGFYCASPTCLPK